jgi:hypothetical protein
MHFCRKFSFKVIERVGLMRNQCKKVSISLIFNLFFKDEHYSIEYIQKNNQEKSSELFKKIENNIDE